MGGSFPGIIVPAANQLSVPQSGSQCGQVTGFADSEAVTVARPPARTAPAWRAAMGRNYSGHDNVA